MTVLTFEGVVDQGQIRLPSDVRLPDHTRVYVVVPDVQVEQAAHLYSPHLVRPAEAVDFAMDIREEPSE